MPMKVLGDGLPQLLIQNPCSTLISGIKSLFVNRLSTFAADLVYKSILPQRLFSEYRSLENKTVI